MALQGNTILTLSRDKDFRHIIKRIEKHNDITPYVQSVLGAGIKNFKVYKNDTLFLDVEPREDSGTGEGYFYDRVSGVDYRGDNPLVYGEN